MPERGVLTKSLGSATQSSELPLARWHRPGLETRHNRNLDNFAALGNDETHVNDRDVEPLRDSRWSSLPATMCECSGGAFGMETSKPRPSVHGVLRLALEVRLRSTVAPGRATGRPLDALRLDSQDHLSRLRPNALLRPARRRHRGAPARDPVGPCPCCCWQTAAT